MINYTEKIEVRKGDGNSNLPFPVMGAAIWGWLLHDSVVGMVAAFCMKGGWREITNFSKSR